MSARPEGGRGEWIRSEMAAGFEAFTRGDIETMLASLDPDVVWEETADVAFIGLDRVYRGHEGFLRWVRDVMEAWGELETRVGEVVEGPSGVVIETILRGRGQTSGIEVEQTMYNVLSFREGLIVRRRLFLDRAAALEAASA